MQMLAVSYVSDSCCHVAPYILACYLYFACLFGPVRLAMLADAVDCFRDPCLCRTQGFVG